jgi:hypothetical protein
MRTLILTALLGTGLFAQTPADPAAQWKRTRQEIQNLLPHVKGTMRLVLPGTAAVAGASDNRWQMVLAPGQACAIPLLDASPKGGFSGDPKMAIPLREWVDRMPVVQAPEPSCADVKR